MGRGPAWVKCVLGTLWVAALGAYVWAGMALTPFHGDEAMVIYMSRDFATAFIHREPSRLMSRGPFEIGSDPQLRIINGSLARHVVGLTWFLRGFTEDDLPPSPGWDWGKDYAGNLAEGRRPSDALLRAGRTGSTLFLALSVAVVFGIAWNIGGGVPAYVVSGLYAVHPAVLLNGRRAMAEGAMLLFGLLTIFVAVVISRRRAEGQSLGMGWWLALTAAAGAALVSKHTAVAFVVGAFVWILVSGIERRGDMSANALLPRLLLSGLGTVAIVLALSPALWLDPAARLRDLVQLRADLIDLQVSSDPRAPMSAGQRVGQLAVQPFLALPMYFESPTWAGETPIALEIARYSASPLSGVRFGNVCGGALMALAIIGLAGLLTDRSSFRLGLLVWLAMTGAMLLVNPLPWQRYYLPWIPVVLLLAGLGVDRLAGMALRGPGARLVTPAS
jgi:hypothetical protein